MYICVRLCLNWCRTVDNEQVRGGTDRGRKRLRLHQVLVDLATFLVVVHAVIQILLILHPVLTAAHITEPDGDITLHQAAVGMQGSHKNTHSPGFHVILQIPLVRDNA